MHRFDLPFRHMCTRASPAVPAKKQNRRLKTAVVTAAASELPTKTLASMLDTPAKENLKPSLVCAVCVVLVAAASVSSLIALRTWREGSLFEAWLVEAKKFGFTMKQVPSDVIVSSTENNDCVADAISYRALAQTLMTASSSFLLKTPGRRPNRMSPWWQSGHRIELSGFGDEQTSLSLVPSHEQRTVRLILSSGTPLSPPQGSTQAKKSPTSHEQLSDVDADEELELAATSGGLVSVALASQGGAGGHATLVGGLGAGQWLSATAIVTPSITPRQKTVLSSVVAGVPHEVGHWTGTSSHEHAHGVVAGQEILSDGFVAGSQKLSEHNFPLGSSLRKERHCTLLSMARAENPHVVGQSPLTSHWYRAWLPQSGVAGQSTAIEGFGVDEQKLSSTNDTWSLSICWQATRR
jgi:hypothetical protein